MHSTRLRFFLLFFVTHSFAQPIRSTSTDPARQLQTLSRQARTLLDRQQPDSAFNSIRPGLPLLGQLPDTAAVARQFRAELATIYMRRHQLQDVISTCKPLILVCQQTSDRPLEGRARRLLSRAYADLGMYQECITESLQILTLFQQPPDHDMLARTYVVLAQAYQEQGDTKQAEKYTWLGIQAGKRVGKPDSRVVSALNAASLYINQKQFDKAIKSVRAVLPEINRNPALAGYKLVGSQFLANALWQANRLDEALLVAGTTIIKAREAGNQTTEVDAHITLARVYAAQDNNNASLTAATRALNLAHGVPPALRQEALRAYSDAQERVGNTAAALKATRQLAALTDSLSQINKAEAIAIAETRFDVKAKNATIGLLNKNAALKQQQSQQQQQTAGIVIGFLVLGMGVVGLFWYQARKTGRILRGQKTEIEAQAAQLRELNNVKDRLFSIVSHDLRGPVMGLQQSLDRLEISTGAATALPELPRFRQSVNAVAGLTDNMLCWALSQMGGLRTQPQPVALSEIVADVLALYQETIRQKRINLIINDEPAGKPAPMVLADENQAEIAIRNIVQNALKFSPVGANLMISTEPDKDAVSLLILDEGPGFDWQPGDASEGKTITRVSQNSTGLGLTVVEDLMRRNGGSLQISRRKEGIGTVARLSWLVS